jgi:acylphosphatase
MGGVSVTDHIRVSFVVTGRVQGVGFRWFTRDVASRLGIGGWVANQADGSVAGEAEGPAGQIETFLGELRRGPGGSVVTEISHHSINPIAEGTLTFEIRR